MVLMACLAFSQHGAGHDQDNGEHYTNELVVHSMASWPAAVQKQGLMLEAMQMGQEFELGRQRCFCQTKESQ